MLVGMKISLIIFNMKLAIYTLIILQLLLTFVFAQDEEEQPLIPNRNEQSNETSNALKFKDPFEPSPLQADPEALSEVIPNIPKVQQTTIETKDNLSELNADIEQNPEKSQNNSWEEELLNGKDEDFKPAPLKIENNNNNNNQLKDTNEDKSSSPNPVEATPTPLPVPTSVETEDTEDQMENELTPIPTPIKPPNLQEQIKPADLITEEIDPWDDPRKKVSTPCRLQLERIKRKKKLFERAEATQIRLKESLSSNKGDIVKMKELSLKLELKLQELQRELRLLKEKGIRQGCPGIYF